MQDTKIQCTIWNADRQVLKYTLKLYHSYSISNAKVKITPLNYRILNNTLQWNLSCSSVAVYNIRRIRYQFVPLKDLSEYAHDTQGSGKFIYIYTHTPLYLFIYPKEFNFVCVVMQQMFSLPYSILVLNALQRMTPPYRI